MVGLLTQGQNKVIGIAVPATQTGAITYGTVSSATYVVTLTTDGGSPDGTSDLNLTWSGATPSGISVDFSPVNSILLPATSATQDVTLTITSAANTDAGTYNFTVSSTNDPQTSGTVSFIVDQAPLVITANDQNKTYGTTLALGTSAFSATGLVNGETIGSVTLASTGAINTADVGTNPIALSAATGGTFTASNYTITYNPGTLTVNAAPLTITADDQSKTYGAALALGTTAFTSAGLVNAETIGTVSLNSSGAINTANAGIYSVVASAGTGGTFTASNYIITYVDGILTVTKAVLTVTADDQTKLYGAINPALTVSYSGFAGADNAASLTTQPTATTTAVTNSPVGSYPITAAGGVSANYTFTYVAGTLTVTKAVLTVTADNQTKVYG